MIIATIKDVIRKSKQVNVYVAFSDDENIKTYTFEATVPAEDIITQIQGDVDAKNAADYQVSNLSELIGKVIESNQDSLVNLKSTIDERNLAAKQPIQEVIGTGIEHEIDS